MYQNGKGVTQDYKEAVKWYRLAAEQGHAFAQNDLGNIYRDGKGVPEDYKEAVKWYRKAADQGHYNSRLWLGRSMYSSGKGVPRGYKEAYIWHSIAVASGEKSAIAFREDSSRFLSPAQLAEAQEQLKVRIKQIEERQQ